MPFNAETLVTSFKGFNYNIVRGNFHLKLEDLAYFESFLIGPGTNELSNERV